MTTEQRRRQPRRTTDYLCARIFKRHSSQIRVKKPGVAVANLARIVDAFLRLSLGKGFHAMSLRDLAEASGLSMGGLYSYFDSKETLLAMVLGEVEGAVREVLAEAPAEVVADPAAHLRWTIDAHIRLTEEMQPWFAFAYMEAKAFPAGVRRSAVESELVAEEIIAGILTRGCEAGLFEVADPQLTAALVKPLMQDWYVKRGKYRRRRVSVGRYIEEVTRIVEQAVAPAARTKHDSNTRTG